MPHLLGLWSPVQYLPRKQIWQYLNSPDKKMWMIDPLVLQGAIEDQSTSKHQTVKAESRPGGSYITGQEKELQNICRLSLVPPVVDAHHGHPDQYRQQMVPPFLSDSSNSD